MHASLMMRSSLQHEAWGKARWVRGRFRTLTARSQARWRSVTSRRPGRGGAPRTSRRSHLRRTHAFRSTLVVDGICDRGGGLDCFAIGAILPAPGVDRRTRLGRGVESRCHLPERTALTFGALRDSNFRTANGVMTGPEHIVDSGRRPQILNGHAEAPPPARPWDAADSVSDHMTLRIHEEQTTYRCSALAVENPHLLLVVARAGDRSFSSVSTKR